MSDHSNLIPVLLISQHTDEVKCRLRRAQASQGKTEQGYNESRYVIKVMRGDEKGAR